MLGSKQTSREVLLVRGISSNLVYQAFQTVLNFAAMLVLVRVIAPAEYGRWGAVVGLLTLLNTFNCGVFMAHSLQLSEDMEPNWSIHWWAGLHIQGILCILCNVVAVICWSYLAYRPLAPLLHLASLGLIIDSAAQLRMAMLRRMLNFQRFFLVSGVAVITSTIATLSVGLAGGGAFAIVLGANVLPAVPFAVDLLIVQGWRPNARWWKWPDWAAYRPAIRFGLQQSGSGLLYAARGALEATVLPGVLGLTAMGLMNRAQALFNSTFGRLGNVFMETVYPLLPRYGADLKQYTQNATLFAQAILLLIIPATIFMGVEGPAVSRLLYGDKWIAADPLIWPGALIGLGLVILRVSTSVLLAVNRLRACFFLNLVSAALGAPLVILAWVTSDLVFYAWAIASAQLLAGGIALAIASSLFKPRWFGIVVLPPITSGLIAGGALLLVRSLLDKSPLAMRLSLSTVLYALVIVLVLRGLFPAACSTLLNRVPGGCRLQGWLGLAPSFAESS